MAEPIPFADEAALYVLGQLGVAERRQFELRLEQSAELRALVRELEAGAVALTLAVPQHEAPSHVLRRIEEAVADEVRRKVVVPAFWPGWLRNGWAAAAVCLAGWLIFAVWVNHRRAPSSQSAGRAHSGSEAKVVGSGTTGTEPGSLPMTVVTNVIRPFPRVSPLARAGEIAVLQRQIAELDGQVSNLSQVLTRQQALASDPGRLAFFQLTPPGFGSNSGWVAAPPSPELQRALVIALARQLGWVRSPGAPPTTGDQGTGTQNAAPPPAATENLGIDFVDLPPVRRDETRSPLSPSGSPESLPPTNLLAMVDAAAANLAGLGVTPPGSASVATVPSVPGFVSGTNVVLAFDASVVPASTAYLTFWGGNSVSGFQSLGGATLGSNPMVVTIPSGFLFTDGLNLMVTASSGTEPSAGSNVIGQFPSPATNAP